jgi:kumamolisin
MRVGTGRRIVVLAASLAVLGAGVAVPAAAGAAERTESFTVLLTPSDQAGFDALLTVRGLGRRDRASFLSQVAPTTSARGTVTQRLSGLGLTVTRTTGWTVTASGPASVVDALLGDRAAQRRAGTAAALAGRPVAATNGVPGLLAGLARAVAGGNDTAPVAHPLSTQTGATLRALYHSTTGTPMSGNPALTVATLQLSGWDASDLSHYAANHGLADPVASGQYVGVTSFGGHPGQPDPNGGAVEVALDQESLLAIAPAVKQRAYFADNSTAGFFGGILDVATDAPTDHIAALSISWGDCEATWGSDMKVVDAAIQQAVAAGVTVFAASGDSGNADCSTATGAPKVGVDFPASDPLVVGVGGTSVDSASSESGWAGSGGGTSSSWSHPEWQGGTSNRRVPDIAADASPSSGLVIYSTDALCASKSLPAHQCQVGGTSLASPIAAGSFAATLAANGFDGGIGDIHAALYSAPSTGFRDITSGSNGFAAVPGYDMVTGLGSPLWDQLSLQLSTPLAASVTQVAPVWSQTLNVPLRVVPTGAVAYTGWAAGAGGTPVPCSSATDATVPSSITVAGDGVRWIWVEGRTAAGHCDVGRYVVRVDRVAPTVTARIGLTTGLTTSMTASWRGADAGALDHYRAVVKHPGSVVADVAVTTAKPSVRFVGKPGVTYTLTVMAFDKAGNVSHAATAKAAVPVDDRAFVLRTWKRVRTATAYGGSYSLAVSAKASAARAVTGRTYTVLFTTCSVCGRAKIYVGRTLVRTVDLYSARTHSRVAFSIASYTRSEARAVTVRPAGSKNRRSKGVQVRFDAVVATG